MTRDLAEHGARERRDEADLGGRFLEGVRLLFDLADGTFDRRSVTTFLRHPHVRARFPELEGAAIEEWLDATGVLFGIDAAGTLHLIDEALTPDSSRFWPADSYAEGISPPSYDKQYVRDYLETLDWGKVAPGPKLPADVIARTSAKYIEACERLTGKTL